MASTFTLDDHCTSQLLLLHEGSSSDGIDKLWMGVCWFVILLFHDYVLWLVCWSVVQSISQTAMQ